MAGSRFGAKDIRTKIINYQQYFQSSGYKRYQDLWDCELNGFRHLFLANTSARLTALCRLLQQMRPSDFVWLTDRDRMFAEGVSADANNLPRTEVTPREHRIAVVHRGHPFSTHHDFAACPAV